MNDAVDFSTKGSEYTKTYIKLPECIKSKTIKSKTMYINLTPPRSGKTYIAKLEQQLQAYKDKEEKLRAELENFHTQFEIDETISVHHLKSKKEILEIVRQQIKNCLQILNEGSDYNESTK